MGEKDKGGETMKPTWKSVRENKIQKLSQEPIVMKLANALWNGYLESETLATYSVIQEAIAQSLPKLEDRELKMLIMYYTGHWDDWEVIGKNTRSYREREWYSGLTPKYTKQLYENVMYKLGVRFRIMFNILEKKNKYKLDFYNEEGRSLCSVSKSSLPKTG